MTMPNPSRFRSPTFYDFKESKTKLDSEPGEPVRQSPILAMIEGYRQAEEEIAAATEEQATVAASD